VFRKFPVAYRLALMVVAGAIGGLLTLSFCVSSFDALLSDGSRVQVERLVQTASSTLAHYHALEQSGKIDRAEAQRLARENLRSLRYGKNDYFWINDLSGRMLMHPITPELEGQDLSMATDARGKKIFREMIQVGQSRGSGFVDYYWAKPGEKEAVAKISFVQHFAPWGWIVGSGIYVDDLDDIFWRQAWKAIIVGTLTIVPLLLIAFLVSRSILGQLGGEPSYTNAVAQRIAGGDLSVPIPTNRIDGASIVAQMSDMQSRLRDSLAGLRKSAAELEDEAGKMAGSSVQLKAATQQESEATMWISAAMEEMAMSLGSVTDSAQRATLQSEQSAEMASQGKEIVRRSAQDIGEVAVVIGQSTERIEGLRQRTESIGSIVGVIKEIADQTNLLALNAAIEAARAGEQGRGFAVVADEVRKLAERTTASTKEISQMIRSIQDDTSAFVLVMQDIRPQVERNVSVSQDAVALLGSMNDGATDSRLRIQEISASMNELKDISVALAQKLEEVMSTVEKTADIAARSSESSERVADLGRNIDRLLQRFRV
jgi:methyl-accepting chemotaxis protein